MSIMSFLFDTVNCTNVRILSESQPKLQLRPVKIQLTAHFNMQYWQYSYLLLQFRIMAADTQIKRILSKFLVLSWKNLLLKKRHWFMTILEVVLPIVLFILLAVLRQQIMQSSYTALFISTRTFIISYLCVKIYCGERCTCKYS